MIKKKSSIPIKEQLKNFVIKGIKDGKFAAGEKIPSINAFAKDFQVARETVRMSLESLVQENYITPEHGKGYFVKSQEVRKARITILAKLDGVYVRPIYDGLLSVLGGNAQIFLVDLNHNDGAVKSVIESLSYNQTTDYLLIVPARGTELALNKIVTPFRRYLKIAWLDRAPSKCKDPCFIADYKMVIKEILDYFNQSKDKFAYFSRNPEDNSVFSNMRKEFFKLSAESKTNIFYSDSKKCIQDIQKKKIKKVFCETDTEAVYLHAACLANGIVAPKDVTIIGCDNTNLCQLTTPVTSSIDPGFHEIGAMAANWILTDKKEISITHSVVPKIYHYGTSTES